MSYVTCVTNLYWVTVLYVGIVCGIIYGRKWLAVDVVDVSVWQRRWYKENGESVGWYSSISDISRWTLFDWSCRFAIWRKVSTSFYLFFCLHFIAVSTCTLYLFLYGLFDDAVSSACYIASNDWIINWKGYGRKRSWRNLRHYPGICLEGLRKTTKNLRIAGLQAKIWTLDMVVKGKWKYITELKVTSIFSVIW
jgi:hypothetical protein